MDARTLLKDYQGRFDPLLREYFERREISDVHLGPLSDELFDIVSKFTLSGGKRIRPALFYYAYLASGGTDSDEIIKASMSSEIFHTALLVHDDIIDRDDFRHGVETVHTSYRKRAHGMSSKIDPAHFGNSMAIGVGDKLIALANDIICQSDFPKENVIRAIVKLQNIMSVVVIGEMLDVELEAKGFATEKEIMQMYDWKTASYTFEGPVHLGAILAGADESQLKSFSNYAIPAGIAFQIRDDILGVYADEEKLGKPVGSDIVEGKQTILVSKALENGSKLEKKRLLELLGKKDVADSELEEFREIVISTGSLKYAENLSENLVNESLIALSQMPIKNEEAGVFFEGIVKYIIERKY